MSANNTAENNEVLEPTAAQEIPPERLNNATKDASSSPLVEAYQEVSVDDEVQKTSQRARAVLTMLHAGTMLQIARLAVNGDLSSAPRGRGRPPSLDGLRRRQVCLLLQFGYPRALVAAELGIAPSTITRTMKRDPEFRRQVLTAEELFVRAPTLTILAEARHNWRAAAWVLQHYKPHPSVIRRKNRQRERQSDRDNMRRYGTTDPFPSLFATTLPRKEEPTIMKRKKRKA